MTTHSSTVGRGLLSVVVPCFNEEEVVGETIRQLGSVCDRLEDLDAELIFVDDGSRDGTRALLKGAAARDPRIRVIGFARNFGHQIAVTAGVDAAHGDAVVIMDADLQDPPDVIPRMVAKWREGYDVVFGTRTERLGESAFKRATAHFFYRLLNRFSDVAIPLDAGDFRLMSRHVVDTLKAMPEHVRFLRGMVSWAGFRQTGLPYTRAERFAGRSKYSFRKMLRFAIDGILSFSGAPFRMTVILGIAAAGVGVAGGIYALAAHLAGTVRIEGWAVLTIAVLFIGGVQLVGVGILGEYAARTYSEIKNRPLYVADEYVGFGRDGPAMSRSPVVVRDDTVTGR